MKALQEKANFRVTGEFHDVIYYDNGEVKI
jgi:hypothetical protein